MNRRKLYKINETFSLIPEDAVIFCMGHPDHNMDIIINIMVKLINQQITVNLEII